MKGKKQIALLMSLCLSIGMLNITLANVKNNNAEYIVLKNNQPTALVISIDNYREMADKAAKMELLLDKIEEKRLLGIANERKSDGHETTDFNDVITELGFTEEEIYNGIDDVEFE